jgi:DNA-binding XRE family transcriptional regulator
MGGIVNGVSRVGVKEELTDRGGGGHSDSFACLSPPNGYQLSTMEVTSTVVEDQSVVSVEAEIFGKRLRQLRLDAGWTQEQFAEAAGITTTYTSDLERGTKVPSLTILLRVSRAFRMPVADLLRDFTVDSVRRMPL